MKTTRLVAAIVLGGSFLYGAEPAPAAPHARILYSLYDLEDRDLPAGIYVRRVDGDPQRLTESALDYEPQWSPDRTKIAFTRQVLREGPFGSVYDLYLYVMDEDGSNETQLAFVAGLEQFAWAPDSSVIAFSGDGLRTIRPDGSDETQLVDSGNFPSWSPDGTKILYSSYVTGDGDIYYVPAGGGDPVRVTTADGDDFFPVWSPDGSTIAFVTTRHDDSEEGPFTAEMYVIDPDGSNERRLTNDCRFESNIVWTQDSEKIVYGTHDDIDGCADSRDEEIRIMNVATKRKRNITRSKVNEHDFAMSPDGRWLVFGWEDPHANRSQSDVKILRLDGTHGRKLTDTQRLNEGFPDW